MNFVKHPQAEAYVMRKLRPCMDYISKKSIRELVESADNLWGIRPLQAKMSIDFAAEMLQENINAGLVKKVRLNNASR